MVCSDFKVPHTKNKLKLTSCDVRSSRHHVTEAEGGSCALPGRACPCSGARTVLAGRLRPSTSYAEKDTRNSSYPWKFCACPHLPDFQSLLPITRAILSENVKFLLQTTEALDFLNKKSLSRMSNNNNKKRYAITAAACNTLSLTWRHTKNMVTSQRRAMFQSQAYNCAELSFAMAFLGGCKGRMPRLLHLSVPVSALTQPLGSKGFRKKSSLQRFAKLHSSK